MKTKSLIEFFILFLWISGFAQKTEIVLQDGHRSDISAFALDKNEKYLASASKDGYVLIWDIKKRLKIYQKIFKESIDKLEFAPNNDILMISGGGSLFLWSYHENDKIDTVKYVSNYLINNQMTYICNSNMYDYGIYKLNDKKFDNPIAWSTYKPTSRDGSSNIRNIASNESFKKVVTIRAKSIDIWDISQIDFENGKYQRPVLLNSINLSHIIDDKSTKVFYKNSVITIITFQNYSNNKNIHVIKLSESLNVIKNDSIEIEYLSNDYGNRYEINSLDVDDQQLNIAVNLYDTKAKAFKTILWNMETKKISHEILSSFGKAKISTLNNLVFIGNKSIEFWDLCRYYKTGEFKSYGEETFPERITFSPNKNLLASCTKAKVNLWDFEKLSLKNIYTFDHFHNTSLIFSHDGNILGINTDVSRIKTYDFKKNCFTDNNNILTGLDITSFTFSPDDKSVLLLGQCLGESKLVFKEWLLGEYGWDINKKGEMIGKAEIKKYDLKIIPKIGTAFHPENFSFSDNGKLAAYIYRDYHNLSNSSVNKFEILKLDNTISSEIISLPKNHYADCINLNGVASKILLYNYYDPSGYNNLIVFNQDNRKFQCTSHNSVSPVFVKGGLLYAANSLKNGLDCINPKDTSSLWLDIDPGFCFEIKPDSKFLASIDFRGIIDLYDFKNRNKAVSMLNFESEGYLFITPDNYYSSSRNGIKNIAIRINNEIYPIDIFDLQYNRPDIVLERIGLADSMLINAYRRAYYKRLKKMKFDETMFSTEFHVPESEILNIESLPVSTENNQLKLLVKATDNKYKLDRINVWINDVPIFGINGIDIKSLATDSIQKEINLLLSKGENNIQVSCINEKGVESLKESTQVNYEPRTTVNAKSYVITISVSEYQNSHYNLKYAVKDGRDMAGLFLTQPGAIIDTIFNSNVTRKNILALKQKLMKTNVDDQVIIYVSGHGLLDNNFDFYFATYDIDFKNPAINGILYDNLEGLLDGIPARKKLLLIDACHSGEVDKDEIEEKNSPLLLADGSKGVLKTYGYKGLSNSNDEEDTNNHSEFEQKNSFELMQDLFANLSRGTGANVISAAAGTGFALESAEWNNGVFTYCVLNGIKNLKADINDDKTVTISELKDYVSKEVERLTNGMQKPTSRRESLQYDWNIW